MANTIDSSLYLSSYQNQAKTTGSSTLGKDDFLKILMVQLQNQDPANPLEDKEFIAQMATFSSLEQMTNMNTSIQNLVEVMGKSDLVSYSHLVGKEVSWKKIDEETQTSTEGTGKVVSIQMENSSITFLLEDGTELEIEDITKINEVSSENMMVQASMMIGKTINYLDINNEEKVGVIQSVSFKDGKALFELNEGQNTTIISSQILKIE